MRCGVAYGVVYGRLCVGLRVCSGLWGVLLYTWFVYAVVFYPEFRGHDALLACPYSVSVSRWAGIWVEVSVAFFSVLWS